MILKKKQRLAEIIQNFGILVVILGLKNIQDEKNSRSQLIIRVAESTWGLLSEWRNKNAIPKWWGAIRIYLVCQNTILRNIIHILELLQILHSLNLFIYLTTFLFRSHKGPQRHCVKQMKSEQCTRSGWSIVIFATCYGTPRLSQSKIYQNFALKLFNLKIVIKIFDRNSVIGYGSPSFLTIFELNGLNDYQAFSFWIWFEYNILWWFFSSWDNKKKLSKEIPRCWR